MIGTDGLSNFARFFLVVNPDVLALARFLGFTFGFFLFGVLVACCLLFIFHELKEIIRLSRKIKKYILNFKENESYLQ